MCVIILWCVAIFSPQTDVGKKFCLPYVLNNLTSRVLITNDRLYKRKER